jgi:hypothetical protein
MNTKSITLNAILLVGGLAMIGCVPDRIATENIKPGQAEKRKATQEMIHTLQQYQFYDSEYGTKYVSFNKDVKQDCLTFGNNHIGTSIFYEKDKPIQFQFYADNILLVDDDGLGIDRAYIYDGIRTPCRTHSYPPTRYINLGENNNPLADILEQSILRIIDQRYRGEKNGEFKDVAPDAKYAYEEAKRVFLQAYDRQKYTMKIQDKEFEDYID